MTRAEIIATIKPNDHWCINWEAKLRRVGPDGECFCPITWAVFVKTGKQYPTYEAGEAGQAGDIHATTVMDIVWASDGQIGYERTRAELLAAAGVKEMGGLAG